MTMVVSAGAAIDATTAAAAAATACIATPIQDKLLFVSFSVSLRRLHLLLCAGDFGWLLGCGVHIVAHWRRGGGGGGCHFPMGWHRRKQERPR